MTIPIGNLAKAKTASTGSPAKQTFEDSGISVDGSGNATFTGNVTLDGTNPNLYVDRSDTTGFASVGMRTNGTLQWATGLRSGDTDYHFYDQVSARDTLVLGADGNATFSGSVTSTQFHTLNPGVDANSVARFQNDTTNWYAGVRGDTSDAFCISDDLSIGFTLTKTTYNATLLGSLTCGGNGIGYATNEVVGTDNNIHFGVVNSGAARMSISTDATGNVHLWSRNGKTLGLGLDSDDLLFDASGNATFSGEVRTGGGTEYLALNGSSTTMYLTARSDAAVSTALVLQNSNAGAEQDLLTFTSDKNGFFTGSVFTGGNYSASGALIFDTSAVLNNGQCGMFRDATYGTTISGFAGTTGNMQIRNSGGSLVMHVPNNTQDATFAGTVQAAAFKVVAGTGISATVDNPTQLIISGGIIIGAS